jgi:hypothetical protein
MFAVKAGCATNLTGLPWKVNVASILRFWHCSIIVMLAFGLESPVERFAPHCGAGGCPACAFALVEAGTAADGGAATALPAMLYLTGF